MDFTTQCIVGEHFVKEPDQSSIPDYLTDWRGLSIRVGDALVPAPAEDVDVIRRYPCWPEKGGTIDGIRLSIQTQRRIYAINEEVRVIHVVEVSAPGREVYIMGPKKIYGEFVDGQLATQMPPDGEGDPLAPAFYDGATLKSPALDYNYDISTYVFDSPGIHEIYWQMGSRKSNTLMITVIEQ